MDGRLIPEMRTAAVSAAVTRCVAAERTTGTGAARHVQAAAHLEALRCVRRFDEIRVWSRSSDHARHFAGQHGATATPDVESAVRNADVIVTATNAIEPFLKAAWVKPGALVNAVGSPRPTWRELDDQFMRQCSLVVDSRQGVQKEAGDVILSGAPIFAEVGELFAGEQPKPPPGTTTVFKSVGIAAEDLAAAALVYRLSIAAEQQRRRAARNAFGRPRARPAGRDGFLQRGDALDGRAVRLAFVGIHDKPSHRASRR